MATSQDKMRVMIAGGGTGGHAYPGIALYRALCRRLSHVDAVFVGARSGVEGRIFDELGLPFILLSGHGVRGKSLLSRLTAPFVLFAAMVRAVGHIRRFNPDVVIGTGGYASVAVMLAAVLCRRRRVLQEQNSVPGMTNRLLSRFAHLVLLSYQQSRRYFSDNTHCAVVGNPLRMEVKPDRGAALEVLGLRGDLPTVLIFGGSRGAHSINDTGVAAARNIASRRQVQFVVLAGERDYERVRASAEGQKELVHVYPFLEEIQHAYSVADVAVARAGASSVSELAAFGVPTVFVPYPFAADDHQDGNVAELVQSGAARLIKDSVLTVPALEVIIEALIDDTTARAEMSSGMRAWAKTDAAERGAEEIVTIMSKKSETSEVPRLVLIGPAAGGAEGLDGLRVALIGTTPSGGHRGRN